VRKTRSAKGVKVANPPVEPKPGALRECDLGPPVREFLEAQGWSVRSEVSGCDITASRENELVVVELKKAFGIDVLLQAAERQKISDGVYVGLPALGVFAKSPRWDRRRRGIENLLKRLEIGLILVTFPANDPDAPPSVEIVFHPVAAPKPRQHPKKRAAIVREIAGRSADYNTGGVTKQRLVTAYREQSVHLAVCLHAKGPQTPSALRAMGTSPRSQNILFKNVYDWFERQGHGLYALRPQGLEEVEGDYPALVAHYRALLETVL